MARTFWFKAKDWNGQVHTGSIMADEEKAVARYCREKGYFVLQIREQSRQGGILDTITNSLHPVNTKDLAVLCRQCATMAAAGVALISCLSVLIDQTANRRIKAALHSVYNKVKAGEGFSQALADHPQVFPAIMVNMVEAGELGGMLDDVLNRLAIQFEKEYKLNAKVKSALAYPAVVIAMAVVCVVFILTFVMPTFLPLLSGIELPWPTRMLLALSDCMQIYWWLILSVLGCLLLVVKYACNRRPIRKKRDQVLLVLPIAGSLTRKIAIARFSRTLGTLVRGGIPLITALDAVKKTAGNMCIADALTSAQIRVQQGVGLAATLRGSKVFTPMAIHMVAIGEESGALDIMLEKVADFYENEVDDTVSRLSSIIEPVIVAILGVVIGFVVIAVALPLFDVVTNMSGL